MTTSGSSLATRSRLTVVMFVAALVSCLIGARKANAQNIWVGDTSTAWNTATNWSFDTVPNPLSNVTIDSNSGNQAVLSTSRTTVGNITIGNTTASGTNTLLTINSGANLTVTNASIIGNETSSAGSVLVTDTGSILKTFQSTSSSPPVLAGSVGESGNGTLTIANGASVLGMCTLGLNTAGNGTVFLTDTGSQWLPGSYLFVGDRGTGNITIANGANLTTTASSNFPFGSTYIGYSTNSNGFVTITGNGSIWNAGGNIAIGNSTNSNGTLTLANGGAINMTSGNILLGVLGKGTLNLDAGAFFQDGNANGSLIFPFDFPSNATINWNGGTMQVTKNLTLTPNMAMSGNGCIFDTNGFNVTFSGNLSGTGNLTKNGNGTLFLSVTDFSNGLNSPLYSGSTIVNAGTLSISPSSAAPSSSVTVSTNITTYSTAVLGPARASPLYYTGILSGNGTVSIQCNVTMNGTGTFTGNLQVGSQFPFPEQGILTLSGDTSQMGGELSIILGTVNFVQNFDTSYAGNLTLEGGIMDFVKSGSGNLTLSGSLVAFAPCEPQVNSGNLILTGNTSQSQGLIFASGTNLIFDQTFDSSIFEPRGSGNVVQEGNATLSISYPAYTGTTTITSGTLAIGPNAYVLTGNIANNSSLVFATPYDDACPAIISGSGIVTINATGNLTFTANNTYTGNTTIYSGTLLVDGQLAAASNVTVNSGATLGGNGSVLGPITITAGGDLSPGDGGIGTLSVNTLSLDPAATTIFSVAAPDGYSNLSVAGLFAEAGNLMLNLSANLHVGNFQLISSTGGLFSDFSNVVLTGLYSATLTDSGGIWSGSVSGVNFTFNATNGQLAVAIPLPSGTSAAKATWLETYFTVPQLTNSSISGDSASPNGDGFPNLLKYAFNLSPWDDGYTVLPQPVVSNGNLVFNFTKYQSDLTYTVEASMDLMNWTTTGVTIQTNGNQVTATYPLPLSGSAFMHVVVKPAP